jgi:hypothetical protein
MSVDDDALEQSRRKGIALEFAIGHAKGIMASIDSRRLEILGRFGLDERAIMAAEWPTAMRLLYASLPDLIEAVNDIYAAGFGERYLGEINGRCPAPSSLKPPTPSPASSSVSPASS